MTSMATERWTAKHRWRRASSIAYATPVPLYDWVCTRCGETAQVNRPPASECPGLVAR